MLLTQYLGFLRFFLRFYPLRRLRSKRNSNTSSSSSSSAMPSSIVSEVEKVNFASVFIIRRNAIDLMPNKINPELEKKTPKKTTSN